MSSLRNKNILPMHVTDKEWLIQTNFNYEESQSLRDVGRWSLSVPKSELNVFWKHVKSRYVSNELSGCAYIMCSTAKSEYENATVLFFYENSKDKETIIKYGMQLIKSIEYKPPGNISAIYYKSKKVDMGKYSYLYKIELEDEDKVEDEPLGIDMKDE